MFYSTVIQLSGAELCIYLEIKTSALSDSWPAFFFLCQNIIKPK